MDGFKDWLELPEDTRDALSDELLTTVWLAEEATIDGAIMEVHTAARSYRFQILAVTR